MIELRWFEVRTPRVRDDGATTGYDAKRVLQYRKREYRENFVPGLGGYGPWSEWQVVPTEVAA